MREVLKRKLVLWGGGVGVVLLVTAALLYAQWRETQTIYFQEGLPATPTQTLPPLDPTSTKEEVAFVPAPVVSAPVTAIPVGTASPVEEEPVPWEEPTPWDQPVVDEAVLWQGYVTKLYDYEETFLAALDALHQRAMADFLALPQEERTPENRETIALGYAVEGSMLEAQCDALVSTLLSELTAQLTAQGLDTAPVAQLKEGYVAKKEEKKAAYFALLGS